MLSAAIRALGDLLSPEFRGVLVTAIVLTLALFAGVFIATEFILSMLTLVPWPWVETLIGVLAGLGLLVLFFFLAAPVTALFAGFFLDRVAARVEARHYPRDPPGRDLPFWRALATGLQFGLLVLLITLAALPGFFFGIGAIGLLIANAYLLSREYFEMAAMRHMDPEAARELRRHYAPEIFASGFLPALLSLVPILNLAVPLFATAYFIHIFKAVRRSSP